MDRNIKLLVAILILVSLAGTIEAQTYNSMSGGYNTSYGTVYGSFGLANALQNMFNQMQMIMNQNILRATADKAAGRSSSRGGSAASSRPTAALQPKNYGRFRPDPQVDPAKTIADALGETSDEKALIRQIVIGTRGAFEKEVAAKGWKNNIAGAFTFFIVTTGTLYHESPEPTDATVDALYEAMNQVIDSIPEFGKMSNRDKQGVYNTLIGFAGIPLATYSEGKQANHEPTVKAARELSGKLIEIVLKTSPDRFRFENGEMKFK